MGLRFSALFSRPGSAGFYDSYDKQLCKVAQSIQALKDGKKRRQKVWNAVRARFVAGFLAVYAVVLGFAAWVVRQPEGTYTVSQHAKRISPVFLFPGLAVAVYSASAKLFAFLNKRTDTQIQRYDAKLRKSIADLRDATHFARTQELLAKWDPDYAPINPTSLPGKLPGENRDRGRTVLSNRAASAAATAVTGAGVRLSSALGQAWSRAADTLIKDDATLLAMLQQAQQQATALEMENAELRRALRASHAGGEMPLSLPADMTAAGGFGSPISTPTRVDPQQGMPPGGPLVQEEERGEQDEGEQDDQAMQAGLAIISDTQHAATDARGNTDTAALAAGTKSTGAEGKKPARRRSGRLSRQL